MKSAPRVVALLSLSLSIEASASNGASTMTTALSSDSDIGVPIDYINEYIDDNSSNVTGEYIDVDMTATTLGPTTATTTLAQEVTSTQKPPTGSGECVGNDSRCKASVQAKCASLGKEGTDCQWEEHSGVPIGGGTCSGHDSRCKASGHATCNRLSARGTDCIWESSLMTSGSPGKCLGNDSRCGGSTEQRCQKLTEEKTDCKWRAAFEIAGSIHMTSSDVDGLVSKPDAWMAVAKGISNFTGIPAEYIDVDIAATTLGSDTSRRLRALSQSGGVTSKSGVVVVNYVISVGGDAPASVKATGMEVGNKLSTANSGTIGAAISSSVDQSLGAGRFSLVVNEVDVTKVVIKTQTDAPTSSTLSVVSTTDANRTSTTSIMSTTTGPVMADEANDTSIMSNTTGPVMRDDDANGDVEMNDAKMSSCRLPLFTSCMMFLWSLCSYV